MDPIVETVVQKYRQRSDIGIQKYGKTLTRNDLDLGDWLTHLQEELMDATLYIERLTRDISILKQQFDQDLQSVTRGTSGTTNAGLKNIIAKYYEKK